MVWYGISNYRGEITNVRTAFHSLYTNESTCITHNIMTWQLQVGYVHMPLLHTTYTYRTQYSCTKHVYTQLYTDDRL